MARFNLFEEAWIPVREAGQVRDVSLSEALLRACEIERIEVASPLEEAVLHRLLLAVLHRALAGPADLDEALDLYGRGRFPRDRLKMYLERYYDRFFLFHDTAPFFQIADLPEEKPLPWTKLRPERTSGNSPTLFDHTTDDNPPLASYPEATRALLVHQAFQTGGLLRRLSVASGKAGPMAAAAAFIPQGPTFFATLALNLPPYGSEEDAAIWEADPLRAKHVEGANTKWPLSGVARAYTWPSRGIRLLDEGDGVRLIAYGPGVDPLPAGFRDPMVAYALNRQGQVQAVRLRVERSFWRDFTALLPSDKDQSPPKVLASALEIVWATTRETMVPLRVLGQVSDQAKILDMRREVYPFPKAAWDERGQGHVKPVLEIAEEVGSALRWTGVVAVRSLLDTTDRQAIGALLRSLPLLPLYWSSLDRAFLILLERLGEESPLDWWKGQVEAAAQKAWSTSRVAIGTGGRHLKAIQEAETAFGKVLEVVRA